jgi:hypothetical protein
MMIIAGTGHRPEDAEDEAIVRQKARTALQYSGASVFICGMAAGFDLWAGDEARQLGIEIWAAKPWTGHTWRKRDAEQYALLIASASRVVNVVEQEKYPGVWVYHNRDKWMVDNATHILAYLNPAAKSGGTYGTVQYARGKKPIRNIYEAPPF